jgi:hypothetical protein
VAQLSEWLQIMLAEIARKRIEAQNAATEEQRRAGTTAAAVAAATVPGSAVEHASKAAPDAARASINAL